MPYAGNLFCRSKLPTDDKVVPRIKTQTRRQSHTIFKNSLALTLTRIGLTGSDSTGMLAVCRIVRFSLRPFLLGTVR